MNIVTQLRETAIALLNDEHGINERAYDALKELEASIQPNCCSDIWAQDDASEGRYFLRSEFKIDAQKSTENESVVDRICAALAESNEVNIGSPHPRKQGVFEYDSCAFNTDSDEDGVLVYSEFAGDITKDDLVGARIEDGLVILPNGNRLEILKFRNLLG